MKTATGISTREHLLAEASALCNKNPFSKEDSARVENLIRLADAVDGSGSMQVRKAKLAAMELELGIRTADNSGNAQIESEFRQFLVHGEKSLLSDNTLKQIAGVVEGRAQGQGSGSVGGYTVPASFADRLESSLIAADRVFEAVTVFETPTGSAFTHPLVDDQNPANAATIIAENSISVSGPDLSFAAGTSWGVCPNWRSGHVLASVEVAADARFDLSTVIADASANRLAKGVGPAIITELLSDAVNALTAASTSAVTGDELIDLTASVDDAYAMNGSFLMRFSTLQAIWKLKSSTGGQYLFPAQRDAAGHPLLLGFPVYLSPSMPALGAAAKVITFGDHRRFYRRQVSNGLQVKVFNERYATSGQIGYETYLRTDGKLLKAPDYGSPATSQSPVKYLTMHA